MNAGAEGQMAVVGSADVQTIGIGESGRIAIGRAQATQHDLAGRDGLAIDFDRLAGQAAGPLHGAVVAKQFVDGGFDQFRLADKQFPLIAVAEQRQHSVTDEVRGCFVAGGQQQHAVGEDLVAVQAVRFLFGFQQPRQHGISGRGSQAHDHLLEICADFIPRLVGTRLLFGRRIQRKRRGQIVGPLFDAGEIFRGESEHLHDGDHRKGIGEVGDEVHPAGGGDAVEAVAGHAFDAGPQFGQGCGSESARETPRTRVWAGGSRKSMETVSGWERVSSPGTPSCLRTSLGSRWGAKGSLRKRGLRSISNTSSCRVRTQTGAAVPCGRAVARAASGTGDRDR